MQVFPTRSIKSSEPTEPTNGSSFRNAVTDHRELIVVCNNKGSLQWNITRTDFYLLQSGRCEKKEFFKIDFPLVPYPTTLSKFRTLTKLGGELRQLHLLESPTVERYITQYPIDGSNVVGKPRFVIANGSEAISNGETASFLAVTGRVYINETQYFANVPQVAWEFYIGGYQPPLAQVFPMRSPR